MDTKTLHAHVDSTATDCDGRYDHSHIMLPTAVEFTDQFGDIAFRERVLVSVVSSYTSIDGRLDVTGDPETGLTTRLSWTERTEEGGRWTEVVFCTDECDTGVRSYRDHAAEAAGY